MEDEDALLARFEKFDDDFLYFAAVSKPNRLHARADICAFLLLDRIVPGNGRMVAAAEHNVIFLGVEPARLDANATDDEIRDLRRCGVVYSSQHDGLIMFR